VALDAAGDRARGATLYCTLEPCTHTGRTGPCVERVVAAGITRVVASMIDPNPLVAGAGVAFLQARGIEVSVGLGEAEARAMNAPFATWVTKRRPYVVAKTVVSADGFVGARGGPVRLTGPEADRYLHRERAVWDAIAVGAETAIQDDPLLTVRQAWRDRPLTRLLFDWRLRISPAARVFSTLSQGPVIMAVDRSEAASRPDASLALEQAGATVERFEDRDIAAVLTWLGGRDITSLLLEGGPVLQEAFWMAGLVDRVQWIETPSPLGEGWPAAPALANARAHVPAPRMTILGNDRLVEWDVHGTD
jgi:diaminohydroxyphosphoribosylaminopyrimidine deaminase/5-amino-6-(5-phosphoribosylamino)uracil reductase